MTLPRTCPQCSAPQTELLYSGTMEHRYGRRLQRIAPLAALVMLLVLVVWIVFSRLEIVRGEGNGWGFGWAWVTALFFPSLVIYFISFLFPHVRQVSCPSCGWTQEIRVPR